MRFLKKLFLFIILIIIFIIIALGAMGYSLYSSSLHAEPLTTKIQSIQNDENYVTLASLPQDYLDAVVAVEDRRFYNHGAIDIIGIGRAIFTNIKQRELTQGGSTLTQQLAKNLYFTHEPDVKRKMAELFMAFTIEDNYSKEEILELYVNTCYFGSGYYGIREASLGYFNKEPQAMDLNECSLIAGIPNAPSIYSLNNRPDLAKKRQQHVLKSMVTNNYISQEEVDVILNSE